MPAASLPLLIWRGDLPAVRALLGTPYPGTLTPGINDFDCDGYTPLIRAVMLPNASPELVRVLLEHGADVNKQNDPGKYGSSESVMAHALGGGSPEIVRLLLASGADLHYRRENNYTAIIDAVHNRNTLKDDRLLELLQLLHEQGADLSAVTFYERSELLDRLYKEDVDLDTVISYNEHELLHLLHEQGVGFRLYNESALRALSRRGRFDAVNQLLAAGADESQLGWTPLLRAVALGSIDDLRKELDLNPPLEEVDYWTRTPFLLAIQAGDVDKIRLLLKRGANPDARGRNNQPPLFYAVESDRLLALRFLLDSGQSVEQTDGLDFTPLIDAALVGNAEAIGILLQAGAKVDAMNHTQTALNYAGNKACALRLLAAGADPQYLSYEGHRVMLGLPKEPEYLLLDVSPAQYLTGRTRRFGISNPQESADPYRLSMICAGISSDQVTRFFKEQANPNDNQPAWCAQRDGQSITFLPDGRIVQVGGENDSCYDPKCIYNDVFVHHPDGSIQIFDYPKEVLPPTDFHTATLLGTDIYLIGSLGYHGERRHGTTPVYRLDTGTFRIEHVPSGGDAPGWIFKHRADLISPQEIRVSGGEVAMKNGDADSPELLEEDHVDNTSVFVFHVGRGTWSRES